MSSSTLGVMWISLTLCVIGGGGLTV